MKNISPQNRDKIYWEIVQRNYGVYSKKDQDKIRQAKVTIVGIGCDGGIATLELARIGVGHLSLIDFDTYETSNLNRQPMASLSVIGEKKVIVAEEIIRDINPTIEVKICDKRLNEDNAYEELKNSDLVLQCVDDMPTRIILHRAAKALKTPAVTMTGQPPFRAFVSTIMPDGPLYEELFNISYCKGKQFKNNPDLVEKINNLKYSRAEMADKNGASPGWLNDYQTENVGWGITPERAYITGTLQVHEALRLILGKKPLASAPKAIIIDLNNLPNIISIKECPNDIFWDYKQF